MSNQTQLQKDVLAHFWGFEKLIGNALIKVMYYLGLAGIAIGVLVAALGSLAVMRFTPGAGLMTLVFALVGGLVCVMIWRFFCELGILAFQTYHRLGEIRDRLPPPKSD